MTSKEFDRRQFFAKSAAASGAVAALGLSFEERALLTHQAQAAEPPRTKASVSGLPKGKIGNVTISRVIVGSNLFGGGAHARNLMYVSELMKRYFTREKILDTLQLCEKSGINTTIGGLGTADTVSRYNKARGGKMQVIAQLNPADANWKDDADPDGSITTTKDDIRRSIEEAAKAGCVGAFLLGARADRWVKAERLDLIEAFVSLVKKSGLIAGVGGHDRRVPMDCEKAGIDVDFYFKTIHPESYWSAIPKQHREPFLVDSFGPNDHDCMWEQYPEETIRLMRTLKKPWIGFKVLAAGAVHPAEGFKFAFENGADFVCAGMFDWQVRENVTIAKNVLFEGAVRNRTRPWRA